jgi:endonuclease/exonuclease/phosphatase family metal-dependent hydrolase
MNKLSDGFQKGVLHVDVRGVHIFVAHLHAQSALRRRREATVLAKHVRSSIAAGFPVLLLGDLSTLSPLDRQWHDIFNNPKVEFTSILP